MPPRYDDVRNATADLFTKEQRAIFVELHRELQEREEIRAEQQRLEVLLERERRRRDEMLARQQDLMRERAELEERMLEATRLLAHAIRARRTAYQEREAIVSQMVFWSLYTVFGFFIGFVYTVISFIVPNVIFSK